ncbi:MAG: class I SAM-dependent methyltransferase [Hydrogenophilus sp.]|nr:class I SAM-dependent methyltransferase [Hydrogenophilus sp.]
MNWGQGYNTEVGYTYGFYRELDPRWLDLGAVVRGVTPPSLLHPPPLRYLELGCGQGFNLCLLAACFPEMEFVGVDFNPLHVAHATALAQAAGLSNVRFVEGDFVALGREWPADLGRFHYAAAHGILSWIARPVRAGLYACLDAALLPGSLVYVSYNTLPGWLAGHVVQHLLRVWQRREGRAALEVIATGRERLKRWTEATPPVMRAQPGLAQRIQSLTEHDPHYLVNEFLHEEWTTFWFDQLAEELMAHKLSFIGTATAGDWFLATALPAAWRALLEPYSDPVVRETVLDVLINQSFRRDLWGRGLPPLWLQRQLEFLQGVRLQLLTPPPAETEKRFAFSTSLGEVTGRPEIYEPLYEALARGVCSLAELAELPVVTPEGSRKRSVAEMVQALGLLLQGGRVALVSKPSRAAVGLNRAIFGEALAGAPYRFAVAGALPWVVSASDVDLMMAGLLTSKGVAAEAEALGRGFAEQLVALGRGVRVGERFLTSLPDLQEHAVTLAKGFLQGTWPRWQQLGVIG